MEPRLYFLCSGSMPYIKLATRQLLLAHANVSHHIISH